MQGTSLTQAETIQELDALLVQEAQNILPLIPSDVDGNAAIAIVRRAIARNMSLLNCNPGSLLDAAVDSLRLGLEVGGINREGYIVAMGSEATFMPSVHGRIKLIKNSDRVISFHYVAVYEGDSLTQKMVDGELVIDHEMLAEERHDVNKITHVYVIFKLRPEREGDPVQVVRECWSREKINQHRDTTSPEYTSKELLRVDEEKKGRTLARNKLSMWHKWWFQMAVKSIVNYLYARDVLPSSVSRLQKAIDQRESAIQSGEALPPRVTSLVEPISLLLEGAAEPLVHEDPESVEDVALREAKDEIESAGSLQALIDAHEKFKGISSDKEYAARLTAMLSEKKAVIQSLASPADESEWIRQLQEEVSKAPNLAAITVLQEAFSKHSNEESYLVDVRMICEEAANKIRESRSGGKEK